MFLTVQLVLTSRRLMTLKTVKDVTPKAVEDILNNYQQIAIPMQLSRRIQFQTLYPLIATHAGIFEEQIHALGHQQFFAPEVTITPLSL